MGEADSKCSFIYCPPEKYKNIHLIVQMELANLG